MLNQAPNIAPRGFYLFRELAAEPASQGLADPLTLVAEERLRPRIKVQAPWEQITEVARRLIDRAFPG